MKRIHTSLLLLLVVAAFFSCSKTNDGGKENPDMVFNNFENVFLDAFWKQYPSGSIFNGYGKYYENLVIPDSSSITNQITFSQQWLDSLQALGFDHLNDNNKVSFKMIKNQLEATLWYLSLFKSHEWDASSYNLSGECYYLIHQPFAPLNDRLKILSSHLKNAEAYYQAAFSMLRQPTREHVELAIRQNTGGLSVFGSSLTDSIGASTLSEIDKAQLNTNVAKTVGAMKGYIEALKSLLAKKDYVFRSYRIGNELFTQKFRFDLGIDLSPEELYEKAVSEKKRLYNNMYSISNDLWATYLKEKVKPKDTLTLIQSVIDKIALQHATPEHFYDSLKSQVEQLKKFIVKKDLFDFDTAYPIKVRLMPEYASGVTLASAEFTPPYQKKGETYYNIDDLTKYDKSKAESVLRENNNYTSQLLSIHEAVPGHCLQGIYNNKNAPDVVRSVFGNGAMAEGWAVYTEDMMLENGWNNTPEMQLLNGKQKLRVVANVIIDYDIQCLNKSKEDIMRILVKECFQTNAQAEEKYHRATVSQVQLCSYYAGAMAIQSLRDEYKKKLGEAYSIKQFHESFLSFGSSPVKYIREGMLK